MIRYKDLSIEKLISVMTILVLFVIACFTYISHLDLQVAWSSWYSVGWVNSIFYPENYIRDFPSGIQNYSQSLIMYIHVIFSKLFDTYSVLKGYIFVELIVPLILFYFIFKHVLKVKYVYSAIALSYYLFVLCYFRSIDWGRWGAPIFIGEFYDIVDIFCLFGIFLFIKNKIKLSSLFLTLAICSHPLKGAVGAAFVCLYYLFSQKLYKETFLKVIKLCVFIFIPSFLWVIFMYNSRSIGVEGIEPDLWIRYSKMMNFHYFPLTNGFFTTYYDSHFFKFLIFSIVFFYFLYERLNTGILSKRGISFSFLSIMFLVLTGVLISVTSKNPFLIKLAFQRSNEILLSFGVIMLSAVWIEEFRKNSITLFPLIISFLLFSNKNFNWSPIYFLFLICFFAIFHSSTKYRKFWIGLCALTACYYYLLGSQYGFLPFSSLVSLGIAVLISILIAIISKYFSFIFKYKIYFLNIILIIGALNFYHQRKVTNIEEKSAFKEAQVWASKNTDFNALFMVDPTIYYGWRDFSNRSSFGNLREWLHTSWLYDSTVEKYEMGLERFNEFGIDIDPYLKNPDWSGYFDLSTKLRERFYNLEESILYEITDKYQINYLVVRKAFKGNFIGQKVFENQFFEIYQIVP